MRFLNHSTLDGQYSVILKDKPFKVMVRQSTNENYLDLHARLLGGYKHVSSITCVKR